MSVPLSFAHIHRTFTSHEFCDFVAVTWLTDVLSGCARGIAVTLLTDVLSGCARGNYTVNATAANSER
jgi:hypothetical protein